MNKQDLVTALIEKGYSIRKARCFVDIVFDALRDKLLASGKLELPVGTLEIKPSPAPNRMFRLNKIVTQYRSKNRILFKPKEDLYD